MSKILLLYPSLRQEIIGYGDLGAVAEPLALEYLAAGAVRDSHEVRILDLRINPDDLESTLETFRPDVVGLTGYSMHVLRNLALCRQVKASLPQCVTVVGGHHATLLPEDFFEPEVDFVVQGEQSSKATGSQSFQECGSSKEKRSKAEGLRAPTISMTFQRPTAN
jgi:radical SAM superfamily enzyme YgiQ (UPF0313 family)